jgi:hypothetical protein
MIHTTQQTFILRMQQYYDRELGFNSKTLPQRSMYLCSVLTVPNNVLIKAHSTRSCEPHLINCAKLPTPTRLLPPGNEMSYLFLQPNLTQVSQTLPEIILCILRTCRQSKWREVTKKTTDSATNLRFQSAGEFKSPLMGRNVENIYKITCMPHTWTKFWQIWRH